MKKLISSVMLIFTLSTASLFSQNIGEPTGNAFLDYMHGRSLFGINFGPTLYAGLFDIGVGIMESAFQDFVKDLAGGNIGSYVDTKLHHNISQTTAIKKEFLDLYWQYFFLNRYLQYE